jgi:hypothetical protein
VAEELADQRAALEVPQTQGAIPRRGQSELGVVGQRDVRDEPLGLPSGELGSLERRRRSCGLPMQPTKRLCCRGSQKQP